METSLVPPEEAGFFCGDLDFTSGLALVAAAAFFALVAAAFFAFADLTRDDFAMVEVVLLDFAWPLLAWRWIGCRVGEEKIWTRSVERNGWTGCECDKICRRRWLANENAER